MAFNVVMHSKAHTLDDENYKYLPQRRVENSKKKL